MFLTCQLCSTEQARKCCELLDETTLEILESLHLPITILPGTIAVICETCNQKLHSSFQFKSNCILTEDFLFPYYSAQETKSCLQTMLLKDENQNSELQICRLCLNKISKSSFLLDVILESRNQNIFSQHLPELNLDAVKNSYVCQTCVADIENFAEFTELISNRKTAQETTEDLKENKEVQIKVENEIIIEDVKFEPTESNNTKNPPPTKTRQTSNRIYSCPYCPYTGKYKNNFQQHKSRYHLQEKHCCKLCKFTTNCSANLNKHHLRRHNDTIYNCNLCTFQASSQENLRQHKNRVHKENNIIHSCPHCPYKTKSKSNLIQHNTKRHKIRDSSEKMMCNLCGYTTFDKTYMKNHKQTHEASKNVSCPHCEFMTKNSHSLDSHIRYRHSNLPKREYKCQDCPRKFVHLKGLEKHTVLEHSETSQAETFECYTCGYKTIFKDNLVAHIKVHLDKRNNNVYNCDKCSYTTQTLRNLNSHKKVHTENWEKCKLCNSKFKGKQSLGRHISNVHTDIKNVKVYSCKDCNFTTRYLGSYNVHILQHKDPSEVENFECKHCSFSTIYKYKFKKHSDKCQDVGVKQS